MREKIQQIKSQEVSQEKVIGDFRHLCKVQEVREVPNTLSAGPGKICIMLGNNGRPSASLPSTFRRLSTTALRAGQQRKRTTYASSFPSPIRC